MTTGEGIVIATPIAGLFLTLIIFIAKRQPKKNTSMEALLENNKKYFKGVMATQTKTNEILFNINENLKKLAFTSGRTHGTGNIIKDIVDKTSGDIVKNGENLAEVKTTVNNIWKDLPKPQ